MGALLKELQPEFPDISASKVRFLEDQGLLHPARTQSGYRKFSPDDLDRLRRVLVLQRERYLPLKVIREMSEAGQLDDAADAGQLGSHGASSGAPPASSAVPASGVTTQEDAGASEHGGAVASDRHDASVSITPTDGGPAEPPRHVVGAGESSTDADEPLTMRELCRQSGAGIPLVRELISFGLIHERPGGFDRHDLVIAGAARALRDHGVEPRHLRTLRQAADREIGLVEQAIAPDVAKRTPVASRRASERAGEITQLCLSIHASLVVGRLESVQDGLTAEA